MNELHESHAIDGSQPRSGARNGSVRAIALACAAVAVAASGIAIAASLSIRDWRPSALVRMSSAEPMAGLARAADPDFSFVQPQAHYDGVYFYAIATDPLARGRAHELIDRAAYRYGHAGLGWLAWAASFGRTSAVPPALLVINLLGLAFAAYALSMLGRELGWTPWAGLIVALSPGIIYAATADTSEPVAVAAMAWALLLWVRGRASWAVIPLVAGSFIKEPLLLVPAGLAAWTIVEALRGRREGMWGRLVATAVGPVLYAGWFVYLRTVFGIWPTSQPAGELISFPVTGWVDSLRRAAEMATGSFDTMQIGNGSVALIAAAAIALLIGVVLALRLRNPVAPVFLLLTLLVSCLNWLGLLYPKDLLREVALPLALAPFVALAGRRLDAGEEGPPPIAANP